MPRSRRQSELPGAAERYAELVAAHGSETCWICGRPPKTRRLHIDHDHRTGKVRGLLCHSCNRRLWTGATPAWLRDAMAYLANARDDTDDPVLRCPRCEQYLG